MVRNAHLAEDVTQSVFLAPAENSRQLTGHPVLSGWLHRTAQNVAANAVRSDVRRRAREQESAAMNELLSAEPDALWDDIAPQLDAALGELSEPDRDALLLRYFEGKSAREMAQTLATSEEAAQKRVSRAVERLRESFAKRGITVGADGLVVVISAHAVHAAPLGLAAGVYSAVFAGTAVAATLTAATIKTIAMTTLQKAIIPVAIAAALGTGIYEARQASDLRTQVQKLRQHQEALAEQNQRSTSERDDATRQLATLNGENEQLKLQTAELLKLRGDVARLRQQLAEAALKGPSLAAKSTPVKVAAEPFEPVQIFVANADATVPAGQTMAFGGWATPPGKRTLVFMQPKIMESNGAGDTGSILLESHFIEIPDETLAKLGSDLNLAGLEQLKADSNASSSHSLLTSEEAALLLKTLKDTAGVNLLSSPRVTTGDGRQAVISITEQKTIGGQEHALGPSLDVEPRIAADGSSVKLTVSARLKKATE